MNAVTGMAIVIIAYNREKSLKRLIDSLKTVEYDGDLVDLIISIDKSDNEKVLQIAAEYSWPYGEKKVVAHEKNMGLKKHILSCGQYTQDYEAVAILEDDLMVSPSFYFYMKSTVDFYKEDDNIAGISLYSHQWNVEANAPFYPKLLDYDVFFLQYAQSWGQVWIRKQWQDFYQWYLENEDIFERECDTYFPRGIKKWGENSWLKYHIRYCVEKNKFFVYPYHSMTTNFMDVGVHSNEMLTRFQIPVEADVKKRYKLCELSDTALKYDVFFESISLQSRMESKYPGIVIDLYGKKEYRVGESYRLSTQLFDYKIIKSYGMQLRPLEANIDYDMPGTSLFLYDMKYKEKNPYSKKEQIVKQWNYCTKERFMQWNEIFAVSGNKIKNLLSSYFKR